ncbi:hypothetical protein ILUMI_01846 [Ignelater luminosus]|uniref:CST complex subunit Stn1 N-terminal domain-containing protein n=1 Tax=Ignelater luminosus TaxID=2038154 RepID=A0A8K0GNS7_IGNLU|nr:hypothetical protein ILUMI_01846 [Ignelater luminosus]
MAKYKEEITVNANEPENAVNDEIPEETVTHLTKSKIKQINIEKYAARRAVKLFVCHLLDTEVVKVHDKLEKHFVMKNISFRNIMIKGTIVGVQFLTFKTKQRTLISVDDGTGVMDCYVEERQFLEDTRDEVHQQMEKTTEDFKAQADNVTLKGALMMLQSAKVRLNKLPHYRNFKLGDCVQLIGTLSEYDGKRSCFVVTIVNDEPSSVYQEHVENLYDTVYM